MSIEFAYRNICLAAPLLGLKPVLLFEDEAGFGRISEPSYCWVFGKERPIVPCVRVRQFRYVFGAVEPQTGDFFYDFYEKANTEFYNDYLAELSHKYSGSLMLLIGDGASYHKSKDLIMPENIRFFLLPAKTPEMNPTEQCWREIRAPPASKINCLTRLQTFLPILDTLFLLFLNRFFSLLLNVNGYLSDVKRELVWIQSLLKAVDYIENNLTDDINIENISSQAYASGSHFQFIFHVVMGMTIGEYIRNRRLSSAAQDLLQPDSRIIDVAMRYRYDTQESFSKAFTRFHGVSPSKARRGNIKVFHPLTINISIQGGFEMSRKLIDDFYWNDIDDEKNEKLTAAEKYNRLAEWAGRARGQNPGVFDALTEWILDDSEWGEEKLAENEQILMQGVFARFKDQNADLRARLRELEPSGVVNEAVFKALDRFDDELSGKPHDERLRETVAKMFSDFTVMKERGVRELIAGNKTGPAGTDSVDIFGYINYLKDCDAGVQWALFMPDVVERQQKGFKPCVLSVRKAMI